MRPRIVLRATSLQTYSRAVPGDKPWPMPETWPAKDPDAVTDYTFTIPLDEGDSVSSSTFTKVSGDAVIDSSDRAAAVWTAWISGGTLGETNVFRVAWVTSGGRTDEDYVTLLIATSDYVTLELTDYTKPLPQHLVAKYPAFADVPTATIQFWLTDAERYVDDSWTEGDYAAALMAMAAHNMAIAGLGSEAAALAGIPTGISKFKSGQLDVSFTDDAANSRTTGALASTRYGAEYAMLLRRNRGGARVTPTGTLPVGWPGGYVSSGEG